VDGFFVALTGIGFVICAGVGLVCAVCRSPEPGPTLCDPLNARAHWRGALQVGGAAMIIGVIGQLVA